MIPLSGRNRIVKKSDDLVFLVPGTVRNVMFFMLFLLLSVTMVFAVNPETDLSGTELLRTIGYAAVLIALLAVAGWSHATWFDRGEGVIEAVDSLFGFTVRRRFLARIDTVEGVVLQKAALFGGDSPHSIRSGVFGTLFEPRSQVVRLYLEIEGGRIRLDEGDNEKQLEDIGSFFAGFLGVEFLRDELETET